MTCQIDMTEIRILITGILFHSSSVIKVMRATDWIARAIVHVTLNQPKRLSNTDYGQLASHVKYNTQSNRCQFKRCELARESDALLRNLQNKLQPSL
jgi:hypothetical protein